MGQRGFLGLVESQSVACIGRKFTHEVAITHHLHAVPVQSRGLLAAVEFGGFRGWTVVSTMTFSKLRSVMVPVAFPAVILASRSFSTPFSPMRLRQCHLRRVDREVVLEHHLSAEVLPVRVLDPAANGLFVGDALEVLEVMESSHQPDGDCGPAIVGAVEGTELAGQSIPGDYPRQPDKFVVHVQGQIEAHGRNQGLLVGPGLGLWLHRYTGIGGIVPTFLVYGIRDKFPKICATIHFSGFLRAD